MCMANVLKTKHLKVTTEMNQKFCKEKWKVVERERDNFLGFFLNFWMTCHPSCAKLAMRKKSRARFVRFAFYVCSKRLRKLEKKFLTPAFFHTSHNTDASGFLPTRAATHKMKCLLTKHIVHFSKQKSAFAAWGFSWPEQLRTVTRTFSHLTAFCSGCSVTPHIEKKFSIPSQKASVSARFVRRKRLWSVFQNEFEVK